MTPSASPNTPQILVPTDFDETVMRQSSDDVALIYWLSGGERTPEEAASSDGRVDGVAAQARGEDGRGPGVQSTPSHLRFRKLFRGSRG